MSSNSTARLLAPLCPSIGNAAKSVKSNVCWALMVAVKHSVGLPFNGALVSGNEQIAWLANDSSKPGRQAPNGGMQLFKILLL